jgi:hypothetical protein
MVANRLAFGTVVDVPDGDCVSLRSRNLDRVHLASRTGINTSGRGSATNFHAKWQCFESELAEPISTQAALELATSLDRIMRRRSSRIAHSHGLVSLDQHLLLCSCPTPPPFDCVFCIALHYRWSRIPGSRKPVLGKCPGSHGQFCDWLWKLWKPTANFSMRLMVAGSLCWLFLVDWQLLHGVQEVLLF